MLPPKSAVLPKTNAKTLEREEDSLRAGFASSRPDDDVALAPRRRDRRRGRRPGGGARAAARRPRPRRVRAHRRRGRHLGLRRRRRLARRPAALEPLHVAPHQPPARVHGLPRLPLRRRPRRRRPQVPRPRGGAPVPRGLRAAVRPPRPRPPRDGGSPGEQGGGLALARQVLEEGRDGVGGGGVRRRRRLQRPLLPAALRRRLRPGCLAGEAAAQHQLPHARAIPRPGCGPSGTDISRDIAGVAKEVHIASSTSDLAATCEKLPGHANLWLHSTIARAQEDGGVVFEDGSRVNADVIMHCSGYEFSFPFLDDDSTISVDDNCVAPLYKHVFPPRVAPRLSFIGLPIKVVPFPLFELQSNWVAGVLSGRIELPSEEEMMRDVTALHSRLRARGWPRRYTHRLRDREFENEDWLSEQCRREGVEEWRREMFYAAMEVMAERPDTYRDEWDGGDYDHLLAQANRDFAAHLP